MNTKLAIAFLVGGVSVISVATYIGIRTMSPSPTLLSGCQSGWHEFMAGIDDQFALPADGAFPDSGLLQFIQSHPQHSLANFDEAGKNKFRGHTFTGVAPAPAQGTVEEASLELRIKPTHRTGPTYSGSPGIPSTDAIGLAFLDDSGNTLTTGWSRRLGLDIVTNTPGLFPGQWLTGHPAELLQLDLDALPNADGSTSSLIQALGVHDLLDVYVQDDTIVDYMKLRVRHSCFSPLPIIPVRESLEPASPPVPELVCGPGETMTVLTAGEPDDFDPDPDSPPASPRQALVAMVQSMFTSPKGFDSTDTSKLFAHTFTGLPTTTTQAQLEARLKPLSSMYTGGTIQLMPPTGAAMRIGLYPPHNGILSQPWDISHYPNGETLYFDLSDMPLSGQNLIPSLNQNSFLDVAVWDFATVVDYLKFRACIPLSSIRAPVDLEPACTDDIWECAAWSTCSAAGQQTRVCTLTADCPGVETPKPVEEQVCTPPIRVPVDRGPAAPACLPDGALCVSDASCCSGVCGAAGCVPATPVCAEVGQPCSATSPCCEELSCEPSAGALWCTAPTTEPPPPEPTDLKTEKFLQNSEFKYGQSASFSISVENVGSGVAQSPITVTDELPDGLTYLSFSDPYSSDWSCTASGQKVTCVYTGPDISPGGFLPALIITVVVASAQDFPAAMGDQVVNCATVEHPSDINPNNDQGCLTAIVIP